MYRFFFTFLLTLLLPTLTSAQGLTSVCSGTDCTTCDFIDITNNAVQWLIGILTILFAVLIMYAGFGLVTSGGNPTALQSAKERLINAIIGFVIVLAAWLMVDTLIRGLVGGQGQLDGALFWAKVQCWEQAGVSGIPDQAEVDLIDVNVSGGGASGGWSGGGSSGGSGSLASYPPDLSAPGACDSMLVSRYFPEQVGNAQCVLRGESTCGAGMISTTDLMSDGRAFSFGPWQINLTVHPLIGCGGGTLNCLDAFGGNSYNAVVVDEALYQQCAIAAQNINCAFTNARRIYDDAYRVHGNGWQPWSAAGSGGCQLHNFY